MTQDGGSLLGSGSLSQQGGVRRRRAERWEPRGSARPFAPMSLEAAGGASSLPRRKKKLSQIPYASDSTVLVLFSIIFGSRSKSKNTFLFS